MAKALTPETAAAAVNRLALMAFFPGDPDIRAALVTVLLEVVATEEQLDWLVGRALRLYTKWPGVGELRALYCSRWRPLDGVTTYSEIYPGGIPSERAALNPPAAIPRNPKPGDISGDPALDESLRDLGEKKRLPGGFRR